MSSRSKPSSQRSPKSVKPVPRINAWHWLFFLLGATAAGLIALLLPSSGNGSLSRKATQIASQIASTKTPWGELEYTTVDLERPDESFPDPATPPQPIEWLFENIGQPQISALFATNDLTADQKTTLLDASRWNPTTNGWVILPSVEVVRDLSPAARKSIYSVLAQSRNYYMQVPVRLEAKTFDQWLDKTGLSEEKQEIFRKVCLPEGDKLCFYDAQLMEHLCNPAERKTLGKAIAQTPALLMKLRVTPQSDLDALLRYWANGSRGKTMKPLLESVARVPHGDAISVSFFFPTFARMRLYTYPDVLRNRLAYREDCFWTAMNFFNETPDYRFIDPEVIQATLKSDYTQVSTNLAFGDVIMLKSGRKAVHMCVYIADDVVFTKNGATFTAPWVLMKLPDMLKHYEAEGPLHMLGYRKKTT